MDANVVSKTTSKVGNIIIGLAAAASTIVFSMMIYDLLLKNTTAKLKAKLGLAA